MTGKRPNFSTVEPAESCPRDFFPSGPVRYHTGMPFENSLALRVVRKHRDGVTVDFPLRAEFLNGNGVLHGGVIAAIADEAAWHALVHAHQGHREMTTTELKVNYLRPMAGKKVVARVYVLRAGKTLSVDAGGSVWMRNGGSPPSPSLPTCCSRPSEPRLFYRQHHRLLDDRRLVRRQNRTRDSGPALSAAP